MKRIERKTILDHISSDYVEGWGSLSGKERTVVYVEGWEDIAFWRSIFDDFETPGSRKYEVMTPSRNDLAKGKKVVLGFVDRAGKNLILCVDSDFDYLFGEQTCQSRTVNNSPFVVQTYTYAIENLLCLPSSLGSLATKITKNDTPVFDFEEFFKRYSTTIYQLFLWYIYASRIDRPNLFTLSEFRNMVRINYIVVEDNGESTIEWLEKRITFRLNQLRKKHTTYINDIKEFEKTLISKGVKPDLTHLFMQGHTLLDNVVKIVMQSVCNYLRQNSVSKINASRSEPLTKRNEMGAYNNSLRDIDSVIADNVLYKRTEHYEKIKSKIITITRLN